MSSACVAFRTVRGFSVSVFVPHAARSSDRIAPSSSRPPWNTVLYWVSYGVPIVFVLLTLVERPLQLSCLLYARRIRTPPTRIAFLLRWASHIFVCAQLGAYHFTHSFFAEFGYRYVTHSTATMGCFPLGVILLFCFLIRPRYSPFLLALCIDSPPFPFHLNH